MLAALLIAPLAVVSLHAVGPPRPRPAVAPDPVRNDAAKSASTLAANP